MASHNNSLKGNTEIGVQWLHPHDDTIICLARQFPHVLFVEKLLLRIDKCGDAVGVIDGGSATGS